jgi:hypothetical protein
MATGRRQVQVLSADCLSELRHWARSWIAANGRDADPDSVILVMTEMVTNSIRHGSEPVIVDLVETVPTLTVRVSDGSSKKPLQPGARTGDEGGRGLRIIDALTSRWGVWLNPGGGKTVWCEFAGPDAASRPPGQRPPTRPGGG